MGSGRRSRRGPAGIGFITALVTAAAIGAAEPPKSVIVWKEPGRFGGWPANNGGRWAWGDEIVVGFSVGNFQRVASGHAIDRGGREALQGRSLDGGETWTTEPLVTEVDATLLDSPEGIDFTHPDFAMRMSGSRYHVSYDRCRTWKGPYSFPAFEGRRLMTRTDYLVLGKSHCLVFITAGKSNGREGQVLCAETRDGGKSWQFLSWISPEPSGYAIMPSSVRLANGRILTAYRLQSDGRALIPVYASDDEGKTWMHLSDATEIPGGTSNPPAMVALPDGRVALSYGYRWAPNGIRGRISNDGGRTWGQEIILRDDAGNWDLGYPRMVMRADGKLVTEYYINDAWDTERYIGATIWDPDYAPAYITACRPRGRLAAGTREVTLVVETDGPATCRYATAPDVPFEQMPFSMAAGAGGDRHTAVLRGLGDGGVHHYYVKSRAANGGDIVHRDFEISFAIADPAKPAVMVTLSAADGELAAPMALHEDDGAASGRYIMTETVGAGTATYTFRVPRAGKYFLWARVFGHNYDQDSFFVAIDGGDELVFDTIGDVLPGSWLWRTGPNRDLEDFMLSPQPWQYALSAGEHTLAIRGREPRSRLDRIIITDDPWFVPEP